MKILVINSGSSSVKYQLFDMDTETVLAKGLCERIGIDGRLKHSTYRGVKYETETAIPNHSKAIGLLLAQLTDAEHGVISGISEITAVGHRAVHGGMAFTASALVDGEVMAEIEKCSELAPLHNPPGITGIKACAEAMPGVPQAVVFDTAFHQTMPPKAYIYPLPYECFEKYKIRRYGFHGTSHRYVSIKAAAFLGKKPDDLKIVTCHLGNGSSITAVDRGKCVDTSMGFTPLPGLIMGSRCGDIDPAIITFLMEKEGLDTKGISDLLNKKSGLLGLSGVSSDLREIMERREAGDEKAALAIEILCYEIKKYIGGYAAAMGGLDAVVFTAGIGENNSLIREQSVSGLEFMGAVLDREKNAALKPGEVAETDISTPGSRIKILVIPTNEELSIAQDTAALVGR